MMTRDQAFAAAEEEIYDAVIVGGGVSGAAVFRELRQRGFRALLIDKGDFSAGTSQASGMLIWGGLLYLKNLDLRTVFKLSAARDELLKSEPGDVRKLRFRYLPLRKGGRSKMLVRAALHAYWLLGQKRRRRPFGEQHFACDSLLAEDRFRGSLVYEEAALTSSDSRFALGWLFGQNDAHNLPLNHCALQAGRWDRAGKLWNLDLQDTLGSRHVRVRARALINAGGIWADRINEQCGIQSAYRHAFSKGVYLAFKRPEQLDEALVFEMGQHGDSQTFTPWGPVALWGPTETSIETIEEGLAPNVDDVRFLLDQANRNLRAKYGPEDVVSMRCGVRPLAVKRGYRAAKYPLDLSRRHVVEFDRKSAALTLYGGKITSAPALAIKAADKLQKIVRPRLAPQSGLFHEAERAPLTLEIPGIEGALPDPGWCVRNEGCATLEDYLRRRTNVAQWLPRQGLGEREEHTQHILGIARAIHGEDSSQDSANAAVENLRRKAKREEQLLASV